MILHMIVWIMTLKKTALLEGKFSMTCFSLITISKINETRSYLMIPHDTRKCRQEEGELRPSLPL
jgi:hypothetical protein